MSITEKLIKQYCKKDPEFKKWYKIFKAESDKKYQEYIKSCEINYQNEYIINDPEWEYK